MSITNLLKKTRVYREVQARVEHVYIKKNVSIIDTRVGKYTEFAEGANIADSIIDECSSIGRRTTVRDAEIGKYTSISYCCSIGAVEHPYDRCSTSSAFYRKRRGFVEFNEKQHSESVIIGNDVWVGCNAVILGGVKVGDGSIIGAGAVVTHDVEPYSIVVGNPAKFLRYRFGPVERENLLKAKWWDLPEEIIKENKDLFTTSMTEEISKEIYKISCEKERTERKK